MDWLNLIQVSTAVGLIVTGAFIGLQRGTIQSLREANSDLRSRRDDLEKDREDLTRDLDQERKEKAAKIAELEGAVRVLTDTVTAKEAIADLTSRLDAHHSESMTVLGDIRQALMSRGGT